VRTASVPPAKSIPQDKPKGGYQLIPLVRLALAWWAYHQKLIRLVDLRVYFAAWEMRARRCRTPSPLPRRFGLKELQGLTGLSNKRLKASLSRLEAAGLLTWSKSAIGFPLSIEGVPFSDRDGFRQFLDRIPNRRRLVPVPRRILRLLAGGCRPAMIATILGHLFRCLYVKGGKCLPVGRVKASWIAETFGVALRRVKHARQELIARGWLIPLQSKQWALNRWGALIRINLDWSRLDGLVPAAAGNAAAVGMAHEEACGEPPSPLPGPELAPPPPGFGPELAPLDSSDENPLQGDKNQEPATGGPTGFYSDQPEERTPELQTTAQLDNAPISPPTPAARSTVPANSLPSAAPASQLGGAFPAAGAVAGKPDLRHIVPEDLADTGRLLDLYAQAVAAGLVGSSEWDRLRFLAAAEHARIIGTKNPCGLFARLVRGRLLHFATQDDEQAASVRLRRHLYGALPSGRAVGGSVPVMRSAPCWELSADARLVQAVRAAAIRARYRGDAFPLLKRQQPEWTRERWDRAVAELDR
jgi:hypothetical protein